MFNWNGASISFRRGPIILVGGAVMNLGIAGVAFAASLEWVNVDASGHWTPRSGHTSVIFDDKMWVIGGRDSEGVFLNDVWCSSDGEDWALVNPAAQWSPRHDHSSAVFDNRRWVLGGIGRKNDVWSSSDGIEWNLVTDSAQWPGRSGLASIVFDNKIWVLGGNDEEINIFERVHYRDVWYSGDGAHWASATLEAPWEGRDNHTAVQLGNRMWVIGGTRKTTGFDFITALSDVWYSQDGATWTMATNLAPWTNRTGHTSVVFDNKVWLIGGLVDRGIAGGTFQNDVWFSQNGTDWTQTTDSAGWEGRSGHSSLLYDGKMWVLGGQTRTGSPDDVWYTVWPSPNADVNGDGVVNYLDVFLLQLDWQSSD